MHKRRKSREETPEETSDESDTGWSERDSSDEELPATVPVNVSKRPPSQYEIERDSNIIRNRGFLDELILSQGIIPVIKEGLASEDPKTRNTSKDEGLPLRRPGRHKSGR